MQLNTFCTAEGRERHFKFSNAAVCFTSQFSYFIFSYTRYGYSSERRYPRTCGQPPGVTFEATVDDIVELENVLTGTIVTRILIFAPFQRSTLVARIQSF